MDALINRILELSGPMPDAEAHRRYLRTLTAPQLAARAKALGENPSRAEREINFWPGRKNAPAAQTKFA